MRIFILILFLLIFLMGGRAFSQENSLFSLEQIRGALGFTGQYIWEEPYTGERRTDISFREDISLSTGGYILHAKVLKYSIGGNFSLLQEEEDVRTDALSRSFSSRGELTGYNIFATFFGGRQVNLSLMSTRSSFTFSKDFAPDSEAESTTHGAFLHIGNRYFPTDISFTSSDLKIEQDGSPLEDDTYRTVKVHSRNQTERQATTLDYQFTDLKDRIAEAGTYKEHIAYLSNSLELGKAAGKHLTSALRVQDRRGDIEYREIDLWETLDLKHTESLSTGYQYNYQRLESGPFEGNIHRGKVRLTHRLYESLVTDIGGGADFLDYGEQGKERLYGGSLRLGYTKRIPLGGRLSISPDFSYTFVNRELKEEPIPVVDEPHRLSGVTPEFLNNFRIDVTTIVVTDAAKTTVYVEGIDYSVIVSGSRTAIVRIVSGNIPDPGDILVNYSYLPFLTYETRIVSTGIRNSLDFRLFRIYYNFLRYREEETNGVGVSGLPFLTSHAVGGSLFMGNLTLDAEFVRERSYASDFTSISFSQRWGKSLFDRIELGLGATESFVENRFSRDRLRSFIGTASLIYQISPRLSWRNQFSFYDRNSQASTDERITAFKSGLFFTYFKVSSSLEFEYNANTIDSAERVRNMVRWTIRRTF